MRTPVPVQRRVVSPKWLALFLAAATFALFASALSCEFVDYDDNLYVFDNARVKGGLSVEGLVYAFQTFDGGSWMPLTWISHQLDVSLFGVHPAGSHLTSVLFHAASAALLFLALNRMTGFLWRSAFVGAVFACHPLRVESVVWIAERKDVLSTFFFMLGLLAYARHAAKPAGKRLMAVFCCLLLGLLSKPMLVTFPFVLLLLDLWPLGRMGKNMMELRANLWPLCREKIPFLLLVVFFAVLTFATQQQTGGVAAFQAALHFKLLRVAENYLFYLGKFFWPAQLSVLYPTPKMVTWHAVGCLVILASLTWLAVRWMFRFPWFFACWLWFLVALLPVIGLVHIGYITVADRYSYVPTVGLTILVAWVAGTPVQHRPRLRWQVAALGVALPVICAAVTYANLPRWRNSLTLFEDAVAKGEHEVSLSSLGYCYNTLGDFDGGIAACNRAIELAPDYTDALNNRGLGFNGKGNFDRAIEDFNRAIELDPTKPISYNNRGIARLNQGDLERAVQDFTAAIGYDPDYAVAWNNRAAARNQQGKYIQVIADASKAIELSPRFAGAYNNRGTAYSGLGDSRRALADYNRVIELDPSFAPGFNNRAGAYFALKEYDRAWADIRHCRELGGQPHPGLVNDLEKASPVSP
jgi:Flp pilus assembly protein TadD